MKTEKGTLRKIKNGFLVTLPTKKGTADFQIPAAAQRFRLEDGRDGLEVDVQRDERNRIVKVTIPGKQETGSAAASQQPTGRGGGPRSDRRGKRDFKSGRPPARHGAHQPKALRDLPKASPHVLGLPFHNPYTFLPFPDQPVARGEITPQTADESPDQRHRLTGILELEVATLSPLLTCHPTPVETKDGHQTFAALRIGPDVIVPATGIRGSLRTLLTLLTGGSLGYLDEHAFLCQGRDANLGPAGQNSPPDTPSTAFLAEVIGAGTAFRSGKIQLGETRLVRLDDLERCYGRRLSRGPKAPPLWVGLDERGRPFAISRQATPETPWKLKLSGRPVNMRGKREGLFLPGQRTLELPAELWADYSGRNAHGDRPELRNGDLIWLDPVDPNAQRIEKTEDIRSIQWARWGKRGESLRQHLEKHAPHVLPDYLQGNDSVDEVTNLFGQVSPQRDVKWPAFGSRVRCENLVFFDAAARVERVTLAPLAPPHPGCIAFYRDHANPDEISVTDPLRGYKVYRTTSETGPQAPWHFAEQGVYGERGELLSERQKVNKTCDLVPAGLTGRLRLAFRALTPRELALLLQACDVPWRLGGGKPLGLGLCSIRVTGLIGEDGRPLDVSGWTIDQQSDGSLAIDGWQPLVEDIQPRVRMWQDSQQPVAKLRYPRAVDENNFRKSRGGHAWFQRHAAPRMTTGRDSGEREPGLQPLHIDGPLKEAAAKAGESLDAAYPMVAGQVLPALNADQPQADVLYGYDGYGAKTEDRQQPRRKVILEWEPFDEQRHVTGKEKSEGSHGKGAESRKEQKRGRTEDAQ
jgi:hypothetical protein